MKKRFQFLFFTLSTLTFFACNSTSSDLGSDPSGYYSDCNGGSGHITITKQGDVYTLHFDRDNKNIVLEKKADGLFTGISGTVILQYNAYKMHFELSGWGEHKISLCDPKELS